ncbi:unnamed protein product, partial [Amoebophrya sp. A25]
IFISRHDSNLSHCYTHIRAKHDVTEDSASRMTVGLQRDTAARRVICY